MCVSDELAHSLLQNVLALPFVNVSNYRGTRHLHHTMPKIPTVPRTSHRVDVISTRLLLARVFTTGVSRLQRSPRTTPQPVCHRGYHVRQSPFFAAQTTVRLQSAVNDGCYTWHTYKHITPLALYPRSWIQMNWN